MEIIDTYQFKIEDVDHYVYEGTCHGIPTKWITKSKWDYKISFKMVKDDFKYFDTKGDEILVFDLGDIEYNYIRK